MASFDVVTIGSALRDVMYFTDELCVRKNLDRDPTKEKLLCIEFGAKIHSNNVMFEFGGGAANTALNFQGLGLHAAIVASVGNDLDGHGILQYLRAHNVTATFVHRSTKYRTGFSFLVVDTATHEHSAFVYYGASRLLHIPNTLTRKPRTKWYYCASLNTPTWKKELTTVFAQQGVQRAWNPGQTQLRAGYHGLRDFFPAADVLLLNKDEACELLLSRSAHQSLHLNDMLRSLVQWGPRIVVMTDGIRGSYAFDGKTIFSSRPQAHEPKDTTGAGDCFGSSFIAGLLRYHGDIQRSLDLATYCATQLVKQYGAQQGFTLWKNLPHYLRLQR